MNTPIPKFIQEINWELLREQKEVIENLVKNLPTLDRWMLEENLNGIIHLIDAIQDYAIDDLGFKEETIFKSIK